MLHTIDTARPRAAALPSRLKTAWGGLALLSVLAMAPAVYSQAVPLPAQDTAPSAGPKVHDTSKLDASKAATYDNRWEIYGGLSLMNGQAGQNLPKRYNLGGGEGMVTYWLGTHLGVSGDYRWAGGTTPLIPNPYYNRVLITQNIGSGGVQWRGPHNRYVAIGYHALGGVAQGTFDHAIKGYPGGSPVTAAQVGLYPNGSTPWGAAGGTLDFNYKANIAIRFQPEITFEHFGTETREFFALSGGVVWRLGHR